MADTFKDFIGRWSQPAVVITLASAIVYSTIWLVQLNIEAIDNRARQAVMLNEILELRQDYHNQALILASVAAALDATVNAQSDLRDRMTRNEGNITRNARHKIGREHV